MAVAAEGHPFAFASSRSALSCPVMQVACSKLGQPETLPELRLQKNPGMTRREFLPSFTDHSISFELLRKQLENFRIWVRCYRWYQSVMKW